jgi:4a-hydroxytetrahydrobiopterin dehydratase
MSREAHIATREAGMPDGQGETAYGEDEARHRLAGLDLPHWRVENSWIVRAYRTHGWKSTLMVVNAIGHLAEAAWHHPDLAVSFARVEVRLSTHDAGGITAKDLELARKIEDVVAWRPGREGGALEGTPADQQHAYLKYDD